MKRSDAQLEGRVGSAGEADLDRELENIYGRVDWRAATGIIHVTAITASDRATLALGPAAPLSALDRFILGFARARADALVTTGSILRAEPTLVHRYAEDDAGNARWAAWRAATLGLDAIPGLVVLSRSGDFSPNHPAIEAAKSGFIWTSKAGRKRLGARVGELDVMVAEDVPVEEVEPLAGTEYGERRIGLAAALHFAQLRHGLARIAIEAGPRASRELYALAPLSPRGQVDELLLSLYQGDLSASARAAAFASQEQVQAVGLRRVSLFEGQEPSGAWSFERYCCAPAT